ncbi:MAG: hypothetical protein ACLPSE_10250, partial [Rhodoblastus sp.]
GPRRRIESAATEDRRGRKVVVERVSVATRGPERGAEAHDSRNARRFKAEREMSEGRFDQPGRARKSGGGKDRFSGETGAAKFFRREPGGKGPRSGGASKPGGAPRSGGASKSGKPPPRKPRGK